MIPKQHITFSVVIIDSLHMTITLTIEIKTKKLYLCAEARSPDTIRELAKLIGNLVGSMEAVPFGRLFYRQLERDKITSL